MNSEKATGVVSCKDGSKEILRITGRVKTPRVFGMESLWAMDIVETDDIPMVCGSGELKGRLGVCRGVLLADVINQTEVEITEHNDTKKMFVVASSDDGYKALFSWQEIFNSLNGEGILVVFEKGGKPLNADCSMVSLLSTKDFLSGPRYVNNLKSVEILIVK